MNGINLFVARFVQGVHDSFCDFPNGGLGLVAMPCVDIFQRNRGIRDRLTIFLRNPTERYASFRRKSSG
jgi:hypothetical protein